MYAECVQAVCAYAGGILVVGPSGGALGAKAGGTGDAVGECGWWVRLVPEPAALVVLLVLRPVTSLVISFCCTVFRLRYSLAGIIVGIPIERIALCLKPLP